MDNLFVCRCLQPAVTINLCLSHGPLFEPATSQSLDEPPNCEVYFPNKDGRRSIPAMSSTSASTTTASSTPEVQTAPNQLGNIAESHTKKLPWKEIGQQMVTVLIPAADGLIKYKLDIRKRDLALNAEIFKMLLFEKDRTGSQQTVNIAEVPGYDPNIHHPEAMQIVLNWMTTWRVASGNTHYPHFLPGQVHRGNEDVKFAAEHPWIVRECDEDMLHIYACMRLFKHHAKYRQLLLDTMTDRACQFPVSTVWQICGDSEKDRPISVHLLKVHFQRFHDGREPLGCKHGL
jgi:hypothetical protein